MQIVVDLFSIPAMSAECEQVFSTAKKLVTDEQNQLSATTIEANELQKAWLKAHIIPFFLLRVQ